MPFIIASRFYFVAIICHKGVDGPAIDIYGMFPEGGMVIERMGAGANFFKKALAFAIFPPLVFVISLVADRGARDGKRRRHNRRSRIGEVRAGRTPQYPLIVRDLRLGVNGSNAFCPGCFKARRLSRLYLRRSLSGCRRSSRGRLAIAAETATVQQGRGSNHSIRPLQARRDPCRDRRERPRFRRQGFRASGVRKQFHDL